MDRSLHESIWHLEESITTLQDSLDVLKKNSEETRYLSQKMLTCNRQHLLATEFDMERATKDLNEEIDPITRSLQDHLSKQLGRLQQDIQSLQQKQKKNESLLREREDVHDNDSSTRRSVTPGGTSTGVRMGTLSDEQFNELKELTAKIQAKREELESL